MFSICSHSPYGRSARSRMAAGMVLPADLPSRLAADNRVSAVVAPFGHRRGFEGGRPTRSREWNP